MNIKSFYRFCTHSPLSLFKSRSTVMVLLENSSINTPPNNFPSRTSSTNTHPLVSIVGMIQLQSPFIWVT